MQATVTCDSKYVKGFYVFNYATNWTDFDISRSPSTNEYICGETVRITRGATGWGAYIVLI